MKFIDNLATKIADKVNVNNDEIMLLTQENEKLQLEYDAIVTEKNVFINKIGTLDSIIDKQEDENGRWITENERISNNYKEVKSKMSYYKNQVDELAESGESQVSLIADYLEQIDELKKDLKDKPAPESYKIGIKNHKETIKILQTDLNKMSDIASNNKIYREAYEYISDEGNKNKLKSVFSHNLNTWLSETQQGDAAASKSLKINRNAVRELKIGKRGLTVETIQKFDEVLCNYFECTVYELVTIKQGV